MFYESSPGFMRTPETVPHMAAVTFDVMMKAKAKKLIFPFCFASRADVTKMQFKTHMFMQSRMH